MFLRSTSAAIFAGSHAAGCGASVAASVELTEALDVPTAEVGSDGVAVGTDELDGPRPVAELELPDVGGVVFAALLSGGLELQAVAVAAVAASAKVAISLRVLLIARFLSSVDRAEPCRHWSQLRSAVSPRPSAADGVVLQARK
ncbi:hypothetical protein BA895_21170 [Humibacillus sp. DSM 29435]|nr:hypothetical protein BA895_21170 [Humibacillus sp. DSM 29435]